jgi:hypothetical protein
MAAETLGRPSNFSIGGANRTPAVLSMASKSSAATAAFGVGDRVRVITHGKAGTVRFAGETQFAAGVWVGVELDEPGTCVLLNQRSLRLVQHALRPSTRR